MASCRKNASGIIVPSIWRNGKNNVLRIKTPRIKPSECSSEGAYAAASKGALVREASWDCKTAKNFLLNHVARQMLLPHHHLVVHPALANFAHRWIDHLQCNLL